MESGERSLCRSGMLGDINVFWANNPAVSPTNASVVRLRRFVRCTGLGQITIIFTTSTPRPKHQSQSSGKKEQTLDKVSKRHCPNDSKFHIIIYGWTMPMSPLIAFIKSALPMLAFSANRSARSKICDLVECQIQSDRGDRCLQSLPLLRIWRHLTRSQICQPSMR